MYIVSIERVALLQSVDFHTRVTGGIVRDLGPTGSQAKGILVEHNVPFILNKLHHVSASHR